MGADVDTFGGLIGADIAAVNDGQVAETPIEGQVAETPIEGQDLGTELGAETTSIEEQEVVDGKADALPPYEEVKELLPKAVFQAVRQLRSEHPEHAQALRELVNTYGRLQGYKGVYENVESARAAQATIDAFGGFEGISKLQQIQERSNDIDDMLERGDPRMLDEMVSSSPKGFSKLVPEALTRLERVDPQAHYQALLKPTLELFNRAGLTQALKTSLEELKAGTPEGIARGGRWIEQTLQWVQNMQAEHDAIRNRYQDPRITEFEREQRSFETKQQDAFLDEINRGMDNYMRSTIRPALMEMQKGRNISQQGLDDLENTAMQEVRKSLAKNDFFVSSVKSLARARNTDNALKFVKPQIDMVRKNAIKSVWTLRYGSSQPIQRTGQRTATVTNGQTTQAATPVRGAGSGPNNAIPVRTKPAVGELDMSKDPDQIQFISGKGYLKASNKWVTWKPGRVR